MLPSHETSHAAVLATEMVSEMTAVAPNRDNLTSRKRTARSPDRINPDNGDDRHVEPGSAAQARRNTAKPRRKEAFCSVSANRVRETS